MIFCDLLSSHILNNNLCCTSTDSKPWVFLQNSIPASLIFLFLSTFQIDFIHICVVGNLLIKSITWFVEVHEGLGQRSDEGSSLFGIAHLFLCSPSFFATTSVSFWIISFIFVYNHRHKNSHCNSWIDVFLDPLPLAGLHGGSCCLVLLLQLCLTILLVESTRGQHLVRLLLVLLVNKWLVRFLMSFFDHA